MDKILTEEQCNIAENNVRLLQMIVDKNEDTINELQKENEVINEQIDEINKMIMEYYKNNYTIEI